MNQFHQIESPSLENAAKEGVMVYHMVRENQSYRSMACLSKLIRVVFQQDMYKCSKDKARAIVSNVFEPMIISEIMSELDKAAFVTISTDASNFKAIKIFPVMIRYFIPTKGVRTRLIEFSSEPGETGEIIFDLVDRTMIKWNIHEKTVAFCADNAPVNFGSIERTGDRNVFARLKAKYGDNLLGIGCLMHICHNTLDSGRSEALPHDIEAVLVKIYKHFHIYHCLEKMV